jgi:hypothetical protein
MSPTLAVQWTRAMGCQALKEGLGTTALVCHTRRAVRGERGVPMFVPYNTYMGALPVRRPGAPSFDWGY